MSESIEKACVICGRSCAGQPRIKNERGQYAHKACVAQRQRAKSAPPPPGRDDDMLAMDHLLADLDDAPQAQAPAIRTACPGCGQPINAGAVVCLSCGFNTSTGKTLTSKVKRARAEEVSLPTFSFARGPTATMLIGASVAALLGGAIWAGIIIGVQAELRFIAIAVGALVGVGAAYGARGNAGFLSGSVAAVLAVGAILGGRYVGVSALVDEQIEQVSAVARAELETMNNEEQVDLAKQWMADEFVEARIEDGTSPDIDADELLLEWALYPGDYPDDVVEHVESRWSQMSPNEQADEIRRATEFDQGLTAQDRTAIHEEAFLAVFGFRDVIFFVVAIVAAFGLGASDQVSPFSS